MKRAAFGIGCFHFELTKGKHLPIRGAAYIEAIRNTLESISNVESVRIDVDEEFENELMGADSLPELEEGEGTYPLPTFFELEFDLYLPLRVQADVVKRVFRGRNPTESERFKVWMRYSYYGPVAFVVPIADPNTNDPSNAVVVVRERLSGSKPLTIER